MKRRSVGADDTRRRVAYYIPFRVTIFRKRMNRQPETGPHATCSGCVLTTVVNGFFDFVVDGRKSGMTDNRGDYNSLGRTGRGRQRLTLVVRREA